MSMKNYDVFYTEPNTVDEMFCKVCGTRCEVERGLFGPTSWAEAQAEGGHWHDRFICPHSCKPWHETAVDLYFEMEETPSKRIAELMRLDLEDLLREHGCLPATEPACAE